MLLVFGEIRRTCERFFRLLPGLTLGVIASLWVAQPAVANSRVVRLIVGGHEALFTVHPYVGNGGVVYAPCDFVHLLGAEYKEVDSHTLAITGSDGRVFSVAFFASQDRDMIPVVSTSHTLGADVTVDRDDRTITLRAKVLVVRASGGLLTIATSYPIDCQSGSLENPYRTYVDLYGTALGSAPTTIPVSSSLVTKIRSRQVDFNTVRIALDQPGGPKVALKQAFKQSRIEVPLADALPMHAAPAPLNRIAQVVPVEAPTPLATSGGYRITKVEFVPVNDKSATVVVTTEGKGGLLTPRTEVLNDPARFAVDLPGATLALSRENANSHLVVSDSVIKAVRWGSMHLRDASYGRIVLDLNHPASFTVSSQPTSDGTGTRFTIAPSNERQTVPANGDQAPLPSVSPVAPGSPPAMPPVAENQTPPPSSLSRPTSIASLTIVIDPGHGGHDGGAPGNGDLWEKNLNLLIAKRVCTDFQNAGAKVLMTRTDDTFIPLSDRSQLGIENHADVFISIHCDSGNARNANEGSTVYYHANNAVCKQLATDIANRLGESNCGIQSGGTRTDFVRFPGVGFSVLRRSPEPAVLVECGYINSDLDAAALQQPETQELIAQSILAGVKDYVANEVAGN